MGYQSKRHAVFIHCQPHQTEGGQHQILPHGGNDWGLIHQTITWIKVMSTQGYNYLLVGLIQIFMCILGS